MKIDADTPGRYLIIFESEEELQVEYANNLSNGGLWIPIKCELQAFSPVHLTIKLAGFNEIDVAATVVQILDGGFAVTLETKPEVLLQTLLTKSDTKNESQPQIEGNNWDRIRTLSRVEKLLLAPKAERSERTILLQDKDAQVLYSLLKNPRITTEEVVRIARSPLLASATADLIAKTTTWASNSEIRSALVHNPRTPTPLALKLLPTLPEPEIRQIAKSSAVSQSLKQAALRMVINRN